MSNPPQNLRLYSDAHSSHPSFIPNVNRSPSSARPDLLIDNSPYSRIYHMVVTDASKKPLYDLPAIAEPTGAIALPLNAAGQIGLIRQWRAVPASKPGATAYEEPDKTQHGFYSIELPRGFPEEGEAHADAAAREVREELGVGVERVWQLGWCNCNTAIALTDIPVYAVLVRQDEIVNDVRDEAEVIDGVQWLSIEELGHQVLEGHIRCGLTLAAVSYAFAARGRIAEFVRRA